MSVKPTSTRYLTDTLWISEYPATCGHAFQPSRINKATGEKLSKPGFWLWDDTRKMNLALRAESTEAALIEAVTYYQKRTQSLEGELAALKIKVSSFIDQFTIRDGAGNCEIEV